VTSISIINFQVTSICWS